MNIILNEREWARSTIAARQLGARPADTLGRIARYYYQCEGFRRGEVRAKLEDFILQCDPDAVLVKWEDVIERSVRQAGKYPIIDVERVDVTESEMVAIASLDGRQMQRLAFTLLCVAKYWNAVREKNNDWVNVSDKDIMGMANLRPSIKRQGQMFRDLRDAGLIRFSRRVDNLNTQVRFIDNASPAVLHITDFRNLGSQYSMYCGEPYFQCVQCGVVIKRNKNVHKYCPDCAAEMYIKKTVASVMRRRRDNERTRERKTEAV